MVAILDLARLWVIWVLEFHGHMTIYAVNTQYQANTYEQACHVKPLPRCGYLQTTAEEFFLELKV